MFCRWVGKSGEVIVPVKCCQDKKVESILVKMATGLTSSRDTSRYFVVLRLQIKIAFLASLVLILDT